MDGVNLIFTMAVAFAVATGLVAAPEVRAHGPVCGSVCVDADDGGAADDLARCIETNDTDPSDGICGCVRAPGPFPEGGEPVYELIGEDHLNAVAISGYGDESGPQGCIDVNGEAAAGSDGSTDVAACRTVAGQACFDNGCAEIEIDSATCGGDQDCSDPGSTTNGDGLPCGE